MTDPAHRQNIPAPALAVSAAFARPRVPLAQLSRPLLQELYPYATFRQYDTRVFIDFPCPDCGIRPLTLPRWSQPKPGQPQRLCRYWQQCQGYSHDDRHCTYFRNRPDLDQLKQQGALNSATLETPPPSAYHAYQHRPYAPHAHATHHSGAHSPSAPLQGGASTAPLLPPHRPIHAPQPLSISAHAGALIPNTASAGLSHARRALPPSAVGVSGHHPRPQATPNDALALVHAPSSPSRLPALCQGPLCRSSRTPSKPNQKCSRQHCKACCQHVMQQSPATEARCIANHHNLQRDTPELDDEVKRRRHRGPAPPPSAVRPAGDTRSLALKSHAGYVPLSWEKKLNESSWECMPTDGIDARKERRAVDTAVDIYWWTEDDTEPVKMTVRTGGHGTFLPATYQTQLHRLMSTSSIPLDVYGAYDVTKGEWTQTELAQKIPPQRVLFLRSAGVRRTPGLDSRVSATFSHAPRTPSNTRFRESSRPPDPDITPRRGRPDRPSTSTAMLPRTASSVASDRPTTPPNLFSTTDGWSTVHSSPTKRARSPRSPSSPTKRARQQVPSTPCPPATPIARRRLAIDDLLCASGRSSPPSSPPPSPTPSSTPSASPKKPIAVAPPFPAAEDLAAVKAVLEHAGDVFPMRYASDMILFFRSFEFMASQQDWIPQFSHNKGRFEHLLPNTKFVASTLSDNHTAFKRFPHQECERILLLGQHPSALWSPMARSYRTRAQNVDG
ncbi:hypothetical protein K525DRAFT_264792 [Schizophyllum commune Loenen D]|nr:hypothetical protein K525DRAFT_264792 [Schizophyllum commune Loenen D]